ncbi:MAG TPA: alpha/beta hydrolase-fold protein [Anaerolineales bacterium]|nr:alpha/beta hydrolase-fold protein [Anaerolineales bacterium]
MLRHVMLWAGVLALTTACVGPAQPVAQASVAHLETVTPAPLPTLRSVPTFTPIPSLTPTVTPTATPVPCLETVGTVSQIAIPSTTTRYAIDTQVYLPPCYDASVDRYPVLYLIHGLNYTDDQWVRLGAPAAADALLAAGEIAPLIIVMPRDRFDSDFERLVLDDVVPYVEATYRTIDHRLARAIGGLSRGGGWALHIGLRNPELFGRVGGHSPAVLLDDDGPFVRWVRALPEGLPLALYLDAGQADSSLGSTLFVDQVFTSAGLAHDIHIRPGAHTEAYWAKWTPDYLRFYAGDWLNLARQIAIPPTEQPVDGKR